MNSIVEYTYQVNNYLQEQKNGKSEEELHLSRQVPGAGQMSNLFLEDLERLARLVA